MLGISQEQLTPNPARRSNVAHSCSASGRWASPVPRTFDLPSGPLMTSADLISPAVDMKLSSSSSVTLHDKFPAYTLPCRERRERKCGAESTEHINSEKCEGRNRMTRYATRLNITSLPRPHLLLLGSTTGLLVCSNCAAQRA